MWESIKKILGKFIFDKTKELWINDQKSRAVAFAVMMGIIYLILYIFVGYAAYAIFGGYPQIQDWLALKGGEAVTVTVPTLLNTSKVQGNEEFYVKKYQFMISSNLNNRYEYLVDVNIFPDNIHKIKINNKEKWYGILPHKGENMPPPLNFEVEYPISTSYAVEIFIRCGKEKKICGKGTLS